jgi:hypothetical protein
MAGYRPGRALTDEEKRGAHIILFGHSWGIAKPGRDDRAVPANVAYAVNFYQTRGPLHGRARITAADLAQTKILGDFSQDYTKPPAECSQYPWFDSTHIPRTHRLRVRPAGLVSDRGSD